MTAPRRLFIDAHVFDHGFEGSASFIAGVYGALLRQFPGRYRLFFGCTRPDQVLASFVGLPDVDTMIYRAENRYIRLLAEIPRLIAILEPDFAHFQYFTPVVKTCPWIVTIHDVLVNDYPQYFPPNYRRLRNILFPLSAKRADILTTVSCYSRERISHFYGISPKRINIVPNGVLAPISVSTAVAVDSMEVAQLIHGHYPFLLCVSRFEPRKNQALLLRVFLDDRLWERGIRLVFVGSNTLEYPEFDRLLASANDTALSSIKLLRNLSPGDLAQLYKYAIAAIYPSLAEGFGMPPLEAIVQNTPSLCANTTAMADFSFLAPFFFEPSNVESLREKLNWVLDKPESARASAATAAKHVATHCAWNRSAQLLHNLIDSYPRA